jgi:hypothetical protein
MPTLPMAVTEVVMASIEHFALNQTCPSLVAIGMASPKVVGKLALPAKFS